MFWSNFISLCERRGVSPSTVCHTLGLSNATATKWKNGAVPRQSTLKSIADYFGVSTDYLLGKEDEIFGWGDGWHPLTPKPAVELTQQEASLLEKMKQLDEAQVKQVLDYVEFLIQQKNKKDGE